MVMRLRCNYIDDKIDVPSVLVPAGLDLFFSWQPWIAIYMFT